MEITTAKGLVDCLLNFLKGNSEMDEVFAISDLRD